MKKIALFIFLAFSSISCKKEYPYKDKYTKHELSKQLIDDKAIYDFLNYNFTAKDSAFKNCNNIVNHELYPYLSPEDSLAILKMDTIFTKADLNFIFKQAKYSYYFKFKENRLLNKKIIELDTTKVFSNNTEVREHYWTMILKQNGTFCSIRMPLFSVDKKTVYIKTSYSCGMLCGEGATYIYRKVGKKWIKVKTLNAWVT